MKLIKLALISIVLMFVAATCLGLLFPSTVIVSRAVDMGISRDSVLPQINTVVGWKKWMDGLTAQNTVVESPLKAKLGNSLVLIAPTNSRDSIVHATWQTSNNGELKSTMRLYQENGQANCVLHWQFEQHIGWYPWERFGSMMSDKILGTMMEKNLNNLKNLVENRN